MNPYLTPNHSLAQLHVWNMTGMHALRSMFPQMSNVKCQQLGVSENSVPLCTQWLMIIIPIKWLFHWGYTLFSDKPNCGWTMMKKFRHCRSHHSRCDATVAPHFWVLRNRSSFEKRTGLLSSAAMQAIKVGNSWRFFAPGLKHSDKRTSTVSIAISITSRYVYIILHTCRYI